MKTIIALIFSVNFILISLPNVHSISVRPREFTAKSLNECYKLDVRGNPYVLGQQNPAGPTGNSMENLISLIEKVEDYLGRNQHRPDILARMILSRFHIDEYNYYPSSNVFIQDNAAKRRNTMTEFLVDASETLPLFPEDALTPDEKCSMYFMLSHNVNHTALPNDRRVYMASLRPPISYPNGNGVPGASNRQTTNSRMTTQLTRATQVRMTEEAREQGVVGFRNNPVHAIAAARVLLGIVAANTRSQEMLTSELLRLVMPVDSRLPDGFKEANLNIPMIVTLGEVWAYGAIPPVNPYPLYPTKEFGARGQWNSSLCQVTYTLDTNDTRGSLAELRGAIDGYLLGKKSADVLRDSTTLRLSSLMRQYYSPSGLFDEFTSVCNRERIQVETANLRDQVKAYMSVYLPLNGMFPPENQINELVDSSARYFENALREAQASIPEDREWCRPTKIDAGINSAICETPEDVVVVVDIDGGDFDQQTEIIKRLSNEFDMRKYGSSMTILANTRGGGYDYSSEGLSRIAWNTSNRACSGCRLAWMDRQNFGYGFRATPDMFFRSANSSLRDLKYGQSGTYGQGTKDALAVPGKPLVFFNYGTIRRPTGDRRPFDAAQWDFMRDNRDVPILAVGPPNELETNKVFTYDDSHDVFTLDPDVTGVTDRLLRRICETPAAIQHPRCRTETSNSVTFNGFVSRGKKQYWAMFPEYFVKSYNIIFEITALTGPIKVCYRRGYPKPEDDERNCEKLDPTGKSSHIMRSANPCYKFELHNCPPFYFTIIGLNEGTTASTKCKSKCSLIAVKHF